MSKELGNSRKYPYPTMDGFQVLTPPSLRKFQNVLPPMPSEFHNREPPHPLQNFRCFLEVYFRLSNANMNKRTWIYASSRLWSSGARRQAFSDRRPGCANFFLSPNLAIKIKTTCGNFTPLCFLVLFWHLQSKIAQIQTVKIFRRSNIPLSLVASFYKSCSVHEKCSQPICLMQCTWNVSLLSE